MSEAITVRVPRSQVRQFVGSLGGILSGRDSSAFDQSRQVQLLLGMTAMSFIRTAYITKARGGIDEAGEQWAPLAESTIEKRLAKKGLTKRGAIRKLKGAYATLARTGRGQKKLEAAKKKAAAVFATKLEILRDDGTLYNSLSPGETGGLMPLGILRLSPGEIICGTNVPYAIFHHEGTTRMPQRRLWPEPGRWPASWWAELQSALSHSAINIVKQRLGAA